MPRQRPNVDQATLDALRKAVTNARQNVTGLAQAMGHHRITLTRWLDGTNNIPADKLARLCDLLHVPYEERRRQFVARNYAVPPEPSVNPTSPAVHQLRPPRRYCLGRAELVATIVNMLTAEDSTRVCGLLGMGGIGKTELAFLAGKQLAPFFPDGQIVVLCRGMSDQPLSLVEAFHRILRSFEPNTRLPDDIDELHARFQSRLHGKRVLLVADDVLNEAQVGLLYPPEGCALLLTSRQRFAFADMISLEVGVLSSGDAVALLQKLYPRIGNSAPALAELCGGLPLALRIAAGILASDETSGVATYLELLRAERLRYLQHPDSPDEPAASVEASLRLSYRLLPSAAQTTLAELSVFPADFDRAAAQAVLSGRGQELGRLRRACLLEWDAHDQRLRLHDLVRVFAADRLGEPASIRQRHADHFREQATQSAVPFGDVPSVPTLDTLEREYTNLEAALQWWESSQQHDHTLSMSAALGAFWFYRDHVRAGRDHLFHALQHAQQATPFIRALGWAQLGMLERALGQLPNAQQAFEAASALMEDIEDRLLATDIMWQLGLVYGDKGEKRRARALFELSCAQYRALHRLDRLGANLSNLARITMDHGEYELAEQLYRESIEVLRDAGDQIELAWMLNGQARLAIVQGQPVQALAMIDDAIGVFDSMHNHQGAAWSRWRRGHVLRALERYADAYVCFQDCQERFSTLENPTGLASTHQGLSQVSRSLHHVQQALDHARLCVRYSQQIGNIPSICAGLDAVAHAALNNPRNAVVLISAAEHHRHSHGVVLEPHDLHDNQRLLEHARVLLGSVVFEGSWNLGQSLALADAAMLARLGERDYGEAL